MDRKYSFDDLVGIVETLRSENGCPWDREQTHKSLRPCMMEEAAELISSIRIMRTPEMQRICRKNWEIFCCR